MKTIVRLRVTKQEARQLGPLLLVAFFTLLTPYCLAQAWSETMLAKTSSLPYVAGHEHNAFGYALAAPGLMAVATIVWLGRPRQNASAMEGEGEAALDALQLQT